MSFDSEEEERSFEEVIIQCAQAFEEMTPDSRIRGLACVQSLMLDRKIDLRSAMKTLLVINNTVHEMVETRFGSGDQDAAREGMYIGSGWCGVIEPSLIRPLLYCLAVEIQHADEHSMGA